MARLAGMDITSFLAGLALTLGLVVAVGPQNLHVLHTGLSRRHVGATVVLCVAADAMLIGLALAGAGAGMQRAPALTELLRWGAVIFLAWMSWRAFVASAVAPGQPGSAPVSRRAALWAAAGVTFGNPAVYAETLLLVGGASTAFAGNDRLWFGAGAITASGLWFAVLGFGARCAARCLGGPGAARSWRWLNRVSAMLMLLTAFRLATTAPSALATL